MNTKPSAARKARPIDRSEGTAPEEGNLGVVLVVCAALFFGVLNSSGVTVILPAMSQAFSIDTGPLSWVMSGYLLTYGIAIPFYGRLSDKLGARPLFLAGILLFSIGSVSCAFAPNFASMLAARILQAAGGAAFPGLGMTLASRAFPAEKRGLVLGATSATLGLGAAVGPLVAGVLSNLLRWNAFFGMSALVITVFPVAWRLLPRDETRTEGPFDWIGGGCMALCITGLLFAVSRVNQAGASDPQVLVAVFFSVQGLAGLVLRQRSAPDPFIPRDLINHPRYLRLVTLGFLAALVNLAALIGFPLMLASQNSLGTFAIGLVMLPEAMGTALCGVLAGRLVDRVGPRLPTRLGALSMLAAMVAMTFLSGASPLAIAAVAGLLGSGFALLNTPIAAIISIIVRPTALASALSMNTMVFFIGGSLGAALFSSLIAVDSTAANAWNPLYSGQAIAYSNAFAVLVFVAILAVSFVWPLPSKAMVEAEKAAEAAPDAWTPDCALPWCPDLEERCSTHEAIT